MTSILNLGPEGRVNAYTTFAQQDASMAALADGGYVVAWDSQGNDGDGLGIFLQRYDSSGHKVGVETQINNNAAGSQFTPNVTGLSDGGYVVAWTSGDGAGYGVFMRRYDADGNAMGGDTQVNTFTTGDQAYPRVAGLPDGDWVVTWQSTGQDGSGDGVYFQRYNASGAVGAETQVNVTTADSQADPAITGLDDDKFVITWTSNGQDGSGGGVYMRVFNADGSAASSEIGVNQTTFNSQGLGKVVSLGDQGFIVTWASNGQDGSGYGVYARHFDTDGNPVGDEFRVNSTTSGHQTSPTIAALDDGGYVITWSGADDSSYDIFAQRFDDQDHAIGAETLLNSYITGFQANSVVAGLPGGGFAAAWLSDGEDGSGYGIYQRVFGNATTLNGTQYLYGTSGSDDLDGGSGNDIMYGGQGDDVYHVNAVGDVIVEAANQGIDTVMSAVSTTLGPNVENLTLTGFGPINGTGNSLDNIIIGNAGANGIDGVDGNDTLYGNGGDDTITGGAGNDLVYGGDGNDGISLGTGIDTAYGGDGNDYVDGSLTTAAFVDGGTGVDTIFGGIGADTLSGGDGNDSIYGNGGGDHLDGGNGDDVIHSGSGTNFINGGDGNDTIFLGAGLSYISGGDGLDILNAPDITAIGLTINLASGRISSTDNTVNGYISGVEYVGGSTGSDTLIGDANSNTLSGGDGNDVIDGGANDDVMAGGANTDTASYASATAAVTVSLLLQDTWQDTVSAGSDYLDGFENLTGSKYNDTLTGDSNNNLLDGGAGADVMKGGLGDDTYVVGNAYDNVGERLNEGTDTVLSSITYTLPSNVENLTLTGTDNLNATGNSDNNVIHGNIGNNLIDGGAGADKMYGGLGDDTYVVNNSFDLANENANEGTDTVQSTITFTLGANVENLTLTGTANINATGNALNNILIGNSGNNVLKGGAGNDTFVFGKFGAANGLDHLNDFVSGTDHLSFTGADYGIAAGHSLTAGELSLTSSATSAAGVGQFVYNSTTHTLSWDSNGITAGGLTDIVIFDNAATPATGDFIFT